MNTKFYHVPMLIEYASCYVSCLSKQSIICKISKAIAKYQFQLIGEYLQFKQKFFVCSSRWLARKLFFRIYFVVIWFLVIIGLTMNMQLFQLLQLFNYSYLIFEQRNKRIFSKLYFLSITCNSFAEVKRTL